MAGSMLRPVKRSSGSSARDCSESMIVKACFARVIRKGELPTGAIARPDSMTMAMIAPIEIDPA